MNYEKAWNKLKQALQVVKIPDTGIDPYDDGFADALDWVGFIIEKFESGTEDA